MELDLLKTRRVRSEVIKSQLSLFLLFLDKYVFVNFVLGGMPNAKRISNEPAKTTKRARKKISPCRKPVVHCIPEENNQFFPFAATPSKLVFCSSDYFQSVLFDVIC